MKLLAIVLILTVVGTLHAKKSKSKEQWLEEKDNSEYLLEKDGEVSKGVYDVQNSVASKEDRDGIKAKPYKLKYNGKKFHKKHGGKKSFKKAHKAMTWLNIRTEFECDFKCKDGEVCISGPVTNKPICVHKKDLKKSMKVFHRYHQKEVKHWKKFQRKNYNSDWKLKKEKYGKLYKHGMKSKYDLKQKEEKYGRMNKHELKAIKKRKLEKLGKMNQHNLDDVKKEKHEKFGKINKHNLDAMKNEKREKLGKMNKYDFNGMKEKKQEKFSKMNKHDWDAMKNEKRAKLGKEMDLNGKFHKSGESSHTSSHKHKGTVCSNNDLAQMQTRLMGWFHLLHGQDSKARKAHGGSIGKFYKHVSVKKELRELDGEKCQCMKSAMWQFEEMDKNYDDHLTDEELVMLEENSLEPCVRPFLESCDRDRDRKINTDEWCCCFTNILPPCFKKVNDIRKSGESVSYMPRCDKEGYFMHEQCKGNSEDDTLVCWCVDYNGNEFQDTSRRGRAHCHKIEKFGYKKQLPFV